MVTALERGSAWLGGAVHHGKTFVGLDFVVVVVVLGQAGDRAIFPRTVAILRSGRTFKTELIRVRKTPEHVHASEVS